MNKIEIVKIENLLEVNIEPLLKESKEEGVRFLERLVTDYREGSNTFSEPGERLMGVFLNGSLIAIGGLNRDPYAEEAGVGRLRRFYISGEHRRKGHGRKLAARILSEAGENFRIIVLNTDTEEGDLFYRALGFFENQRYAKATHYVELECGVE